MPDRVTDRIGHALLIADVPELVEVVCQPVVSADLTLELDRVRCEAATALAWVQGWLDNWLPQLRYSRSVTLHEIRQGEDQLRRCTVHLRRVLDPNAT